MCNKMHKFLIAAAAGLMASTAMAADGTIFFNGSISDASCNLSGTGTTAGSPQGAQNITVNLGKTSMDTLGGSGGTSTGIVAGGTAINLKLDCGATSEGLNRVKMSFDPASGSGVDSKDNRLLQTTGGATGVGIGIYKADNTLLNLGAGETFNADLKAGTESGGKKPYTADLALRAAYVTNGDTLTAGDANGTLPFSLTYE